MDAPKLIKKSRAGLLSLLCSAPGLILILFHPCMDVLLLSCPIRPSSFPHNTHKLDKGKPPPMQRHGRHIQLSIPGNHVSNNHIILAQDPEQKFYNILAGAWTGPECVLAGPGRVGRRVLWGFWDLPKPWDSQMRLCWGGPVGILGGSLEDGLCKKKRQIVGFCCVLMVCAFLGWVWGPLGWP